MRELEADIQALAQEFSGCRHILQALGDETRQHLILSMMQMGQCEGCRVGAITEKTSLSRPAVSHHLQILKQAGLLKVRREGTEKLLLFRCGHGSDEQSDPDAGTCQAGHGCIAGAHQ